MTSKLLAPSMAWMHLVSVKNPRTLETASRSLCRNVVLQGTVWPERVHRCSHPVVSDSKRQTAANEWRCVRVALWETVPQGKGLAMSD